MSEMTDPVEDETSQEDDAIPGQDIDLEQLAEQIVKLLLRELEIERQRTGNY